MAFKLFESQKPIANNESLVLRKTYKLLIYKINPKTKKWKQL